MSISSEIDKLTREECIKILRDRFGELVNNLIKGKDPVLVMPKRILSNTIYDEKNKLLLLGPEMLKRSFLDVNETKKFMQTLLMASIIYEALVNNEYPTIRDLYYRGKHSINYRDLSGKIYYENTWDEQRESDSVIRDLEVYLGVLREKLLILSKEKGKVVGNLVIKSGDDVIDLSKMGHGAYSIEPTPDLIEFRDVNAEYVLVVEKDAVFQQLHRYGFWKKNRAILVTSAGQPDRATRRFVRRLNEELKLPVYILTDADPYGFYIYSVFKVGSITLSYESERLATPNAKFIGVSLTDIFGTSI
ncbi:MAG: DNA topoisomerase IV subunit A, partial [Desulfurococcaceae archaeon]